MEKILEIIDKSDNEIKKIFSEYNISLTPDEGRQICKMLKRNPTLTEIVIWNIQSSEHSSYKSSKKYLSKLLTKGSSVLLGPCEDAGVVKFHTDKNGKDYGIVYAHESHNHPSQVVPYEGAATGVGGICRDIACMGAEVIGILDCLRFGDIKNKKNNYIAKEAVRGISGYGNPLGVPNLGGDVFFDDSFNTNCLVNVVALGSIKFDDLIHSFVPKNAKNENYDFILVGKATDRSGFGGTAFSSSDLSEDDAEKNKGAVQEPNPFLERHLFTSFRDLFKKLKEKNELNNIGLKDLGAGGILCATVELVAEVGMGAEINLNSVHIAENIPAPVIACSETQERFCFAVPARLTDFILDHFNNTWDFANVANNAKASKIGKVLNNDKYIVYFNEEKICDAKSIDITKGITVNRETKEITKFDNNIYFKDKTIDKDFIEKFIKSENIFSKKPFYQSYDQTVQGRTQTLRDKTDAVSFMPLKYFKELAEKEKNLLACVSCSGHPKLGKINAKLQGEWSVASSILKVASAGGTPLALTDCLNYGNPESPEQMKEFTDGIEGISNISNYLNIPFVSGNVSLYNCSKNSSVSPSAIISCVGKINKNSRENIFQNEGNIILLVGEKSNETRGCIAEDIFCNLPSNRKSKFEIVNKQEIKKIIDFLIKENKIKSSCVVQEGGILKSLIYMSVFSQKGFNLHKDMSIENLVSEKLSVIIEVKKEDLENIKQSLQKFELPFNVLGETTNNENIKINDFKINLSEISDKIKNGLYEYL